MIQACPSCGTMFRHSEPRAGRRARCACCLEVFPLATRPAYRVIEPPDPAPCAPGEAVLVASTFAAVGAATSRLASPAAVLARPGRRTGESDLPDMFPFFPVERAVGGEEPQAPSVGSSGTLRIATEVESDSGPAIWLAAAAAGTLAGLAVDSAVVGPMGAWPLGGALVGLMAVWGHRRWTLRRS